MAIQCYQKMIKILIFGLLCSSIYLGSWVAKVPNANSVQVIDRIVAIVNDNVITQFELQRSFQPYVEKIENLGYPLDKKREMLFKVREEVLNKLIDKKIEELEIKRHKITVDEEEIDQMIERIKETNYYTDEDLRAALASEGLTMDDYRERLKQQVLRSKLVNREVKSKIVITKEDIKAYYDDHKEKYGGDKKYHLRNILMKVPAFSSQAEREEIKSKMEQVLEKLKEGEPFETIAATYSESPLASEGGDLGLFELNQLSQVIQKAISGLKPGELTPVLDTDQGYQIFLVEDIVQTPGRSLEEIAPEIERVLFNEIVDKKFQSWLDELRKRANIKIIK